MFMRIQRKRLSSGKEGLYASLVRCDWVDGRPRQTTVAYLGRVEEDQVPFLKGPFCVKCGKPIDSEQDEFCDDCEGRKRDFVRGVSLMDYSKHYADRLMWDVKYNNKKEYADFLALELARRYARSIENWGCQVIVPVPVHASRRRKRGYNQAELIAQRLGCLLDMKVDAKALIRTRKTAPQKNLDAAGRLENLKSAFAPGKTAAGYDNVLLLDDIYTTGATMQVCTKVLMGAGVKSVYVMTCAIGYN